jgi:hypothetical protein
MNQTATLRRERRVAPRRHANILASIAYNGGRSHMGCIIRNLSEGGAKLEVARSVRDIPQTFELLRPGFDPQPCRVVWRALKEIGVTFV